MLGPSAFWEALFDPGDPAPNFVRQLAMRDMGERCPHTNENMHAACEACLRKVLGAWRERKFLLTVRVNRAISDLAIVFVPFSETKYHADIDSAGHKMLEFLQWLTDEAGMRLVTDNAQGNSLTYSNFRHDQEWTAHARERDLLPLIPLCALVCNLGYGDNPERQRRVLASAARKEKVGTPDLLTFIRSGDVTSASEIFTNFSASLGASLEHDN